MKVRIRTLSIAWFIVAAMLTVCPGCGDGSSSTKSGPDETITRFFAALQKGDHDAMAKVIPAGYSLSSFDVRRNTMMLPEEDRRGASYSNADPIEPHDLAEISKILREHLRDLEITVVKRHGHPSGFIEVYRNGPRAKVQGGAEMQIRFGSQVTEFTDENTGLESSRPEPQKGSYGEERWACEYAASADVVIRQKGTAKTVLMPRESFMVVRRNRNSPWLIIGVPDSILKYGLRESGNNRHPYYMK